MYKSMCDLLPLLETSSQKSHSADPHGALQRPEEAATFACVWSRRRGKVCSENHGKEGAGEEIYCVLFLCTVLGTLLRLLKEPHEITDKNFGYE